MDPTSRSRDRGRTERSGRGTRPVWFAELKGSRVKQRTETQRRDLTTRLRKSE